MGLGADAKGGVRVVKSVEDVRKNAVEMLGRVLVTHQTGPHGRQVNRLYIEEGADIARELYLSLLVDRETSRVAVVASTEGGMDIEDVAHSTPEKIITIQIDPATGVFPHHGRALAEALELKGDLAKQAFKLLGQLYAAFVAKDMDMLEVNPLIVTGDGQLKVLDAKVSFDSNALFRHKDIVELRDTGEGGRQGDRGLQTRPLLHRARRRDRLHGQRRRAGHGHHGHHQALWRRARQLPGRGRWRLEGEGRGGLQDHHRRPPT